MIEFLGQAGHVIEAVVKTSLPYLQSFGVLAGLSTSLALVLIAPYKVVKRWYEHHKIMMQFFAALAGVGLANLGARFKSPAINPMLVQLYGIAMGFGSSASWNTVLKPLGQATRDKIIAADKKNEEVKSALKPLVVPTPSAQLIDPQIITATTAQSTDFHD